MTKKRLWSVVLLSGLLIAALSGAVAGLLIDVAGHWASPIISALEARGIVSGDTAGRFDPDGPLTRAQLAKLLVVSRGREADAKVLDSVPSRFVDLPASHWARGLVESLAEMGVTVGFPDGSFKPSQSVSRAEAAILFVRAAGLGDQARLHRFEPTPFVDDTLVPSWARGEINVAHRYGLMTGFEDRSFRPDLTMTRAQGAVATLRLAEFGGTAYHLAGTLVRFDLTTRRGIVRDALGQDRAFTMADSAQYFRGGIGVGPQAIRLLDQVWVVMGSQNTGLMLEARYSDLMGRNPTITDKAVTVRLSSEASRTLHLQSGAMVFMNGLSIASTDGITATLAYMALDVATGEVRVLDLVHTSLEGILVGADPTANTVTLSTDQGTRSFPVTSSAVILQDGSRVLIRNLRLGSTVNAAVDLNQEITYLQAEG